ncbi:MAG TPA: tannase/feruloyl esterase family alpha/beta hydrolase [Aliidongia sp.]|uniref:3-hydroxybutyrate oligomer hydrolase family protein n=1 Tax=Aliidongia sp. TaxID=1914230 RepID=UPI002DDCFA22|nr:tannase/feruloyl esterase family alpha/beta hydrolase [Aliidongia sp.]HEV2675588.1 tannase/feruloyl esterase family alpha/beta hydrolase [Aliidongia sp.]
MESLRLAGWGGLAALALSIGWQAPAAAAGRCDQLLALLHGQIADATCVDSADLTTANPATTPANNALAGLPAFAFTPQTDRATIAPSAPDQTPLTHAVPGLQIQARLAKDPLGEARILVRLPNNWNGKLVVAGASGTRSEFNGDIAWSDYVLQKGYAYVSQNKGVYNFQLSSAADPLACRLNPASSIYVHFYDNDPAALFTRWNEAMLAAARLGRDAVELRYGRRPARTYAVGTSNGGYQVRRAVETAPDLFDGGVDWEGTYVDPTRGNILASLPPALLNYPDYVASGFDPNSTAAKNIVAAGYPPDIVSGTNSLWGFYWAQFWEVTQCQWQKRLDPGYDTYGAGPANYVYVDRLSASNVGANLAAFTTTGHIQRPLITVAGTMDALLPINDQARAYARAVDAGRGDDREQDRRHDRTPPYRLYEVQNGNHIETFKGSFPQLELIEPHAQKAFDLLVGYVEQGAALPPDQCIPHGGAIASSPAQPGHCSSLFVP